MGIIGSETVGAARTVSIAMVATRCNATRRSVANNTCVASIARLSYSVKSYSIPTRRFCACPSGERPRRPSPALLSFRTPVTTFNRNGNRFATLNLLARVGRGALAFVIDRQLSFHVPE